MLICFVLYIHFRCHLQDYDHEHASVSDNKNKAFLKFLRSVDIDSRNGDTTVDVDPNVRPGGDLHGYLRELRSSARSVTYWTPLRSKMLL